MGRRGPKSITEEHDHYWRTLAVQTIGGVDFLIETCTHAACKTRRATRPPTAAAQRATVTTPCPAAAPPN